MKWLINFDDVSITYLITYKIYKNTFLFTKAFLVGNDYGNLLTSQFGSIEYDHTSKYNFNDQLNLISRDHVNFRVKQ